MFETSASTEKLDAALAKAQGQIRAALKDSNNPFFNSKYADLPAVWAACQGPLTENGISVTQWPCHSADSRLHIVTRLAHAGEWMRCEFSIPVAKQDPQGFGSAVTYARRFALAAAVGVVADADDDGNAASGNGKGESSARKPAARAQNVPTGAPASPPPAGAPSGSVPLDEFALWKKELDDAQNAATFRAVGQRISGARLSEELRMRLSAYYAEVGPKHGIHPKKKPAEKKTPGPCRACGDKDHADINCPSLTGDERAELLREAAANG